VDWLDLAIIGLLVVAAVNGFRRGAALQLMVYAGLLAGLLVGALVAPKFAARVSSPAVSAVVALGVLLAFSALGDAVGWAIGRRFQGLTHRTFLRTADSVAGSVVAVVALLVAVWFLAWNLVNGPIEPVSSQIRGSAIVQRLDRTFPRPPSLLADVRGFLNRFGFPEVFSGLPPAPAGPVALPTDAAIRDAVVKAQPATVRIVGEACGAIQEGSGFAIAPNYIITNAHVVAGEHTTEVQQQNGGSQSATVVVYDPKLDVAILRVGEPLAHALSLDQKDVGRGEEGAVLGFPGGGPFRSDRAAVRRDLEAVGRDIYGRSEVQRDVYELQAVVRPGNSGGPFVLLDGTVAGVVFAASTTDGDVGYALTTPQILPLVQRAEVRTAAVSTQRCER
jgi:S1-C subfamily serine protease